MRGKPAAGGVRPSRPGDKASGVPCVALGRLSSLIAVGTVLLAHTPLHPVPLRADPFLPRGLPKANWGAAR